MKKLGGILIAVAFMAHFLDAKGKSEDVKTNIGAAEGFGGGGGGAR